MSSLYHDRAMSLCQGARLNQAALSCKINGYNIAEMAAMEVERTD